MKTGYLGLIALGTFAATSLALAFWGEIPGEKKVAPAASATTQPTTTSAAQEAPETIPRAEWPPMGLFYKERGDYRPITEESDVRGVPLYSYSNGSYQPWTRKVPAAQRTAQADPAAPARTPLDNEWLWAHKLKRPVFGLLWWMSVGMGLGVFCGAVWKHTHHILLPCGILAAGIMSTAAAEGPLAEAAVKVFGAAPNTAVLAIMAGAAWFAALVKSAPPAK